MIDTLRRELCTAARALRRAPGTSAAAILTLALAIGAGTALFSVADAVLWKPLPFPREERVVRIVLTRHDGGGWYSVSYHNYFYWRRRSRSFAALAAVRPRTVVLPEDDGGGERLAAVEVTPSYFEVAGVAPRLGRGIGPADAEPGAPPVAVLTHELWARRFGADPGVIGRGLALREGNWTVIGVMPPSADGMAGRARLWLPLRVDEGAALAAPLPGFSVLGRLAPGTTPDRARRELAGVARWLERERPETNRGWGIELQPIRWWQVGEYGASLWIVLGAVAAVLAIACVNVANLLLARGADRGREMAVRRALGASRADLLRPLLAESVLLGLVGGALGLVLAAAAVPALVRLAPDSLPRLGAVGIDGRALGACLAASLAAGCLSGLLSGFRGASARAAALQRGRGDAGDGRPARRLAGLLVAAEVALAVVVVAGSLLLGRSWERLQAVDLGFDPRALLTLRFELPPGSLPERAERIARYRQLLERIEALPGVESAAATGVELPLVEGQGVFELFVEGQPRGVRPDHPVTAQMVSPGYFRTMGIRLLAGRPFDPLDSWEASRSVVVNQTFARRYFPAGPSGPAGEPAESAAVGRWVEWGNGDRGTIIGVVADVRQLEVSRQAAAEAYLAWGTAAAEQALVVRAAVAPASLAPAVRRQILAVAPGATVWDPRTGDELVGRSLARRRFASLLFGLFGAVAVALGAVGVYGVTAHATRRRRREIGVRMALGAVPGRIFRLVLAGGLAPVAAGLVVGGVAAVGTGRLLASLLYEISPADPAALAAASLILAATGLGAALAPALRALATDPVVTLRVE
jgi:putative ABC transport system permease protein